MPSKKPIHKSVFIALKKFNEWISQYQFLSKNNPNTLLKFLISSDGKGFTYIKNYEQFCQLQRIMQLDKPKEEISFISAYDFGVAVLEAYPESFGEIVPTLPEDVKIPLMAQKFHDWMKKQTHNETLVSYPFYHNSKLTQFFEKNDILMYIQDYDTFCALADYLKTIMLYNTTNPPCDEVFFYDIVQKHENEHFYSMPVIIPERIIRLKLAEETVNQIFQQAIEKTVATDAEEPSGLTSISPENETLVNPGRINSGFHRPKCSWMTNDSPRSAPEAVEVLSPPTLS